MPVTSLLQHARLTRPLLAAALFCAPFAAHALNPADAQEIQNFTLNEDFLHRYEALAADAKSHPAAHEAQEMTAQQLQQNFSSISAMEQKIASVPGATSLIQQHGLSLHQYVVGSLSLMKTAVAVQMGGQMAKFQNDPRFAGVMAKARADQPSPANIAFYKAHHTEIEKMMAESGDDGQDSGQ